jgi:murein DD-endopeptidase MepM/ murein hydrolase activator NlpD
MANDNKSWISIMIVPEDGTKVRKWRITNKRFTFLKTVLVTMFLVLLVGIASMVGLGLMYGKLKEYKRFNAQLLEATSKLDTIASVLERYEEKERKLRTIIGSDFQLPGAMRPENIDSDSRLVMASNENTTDEFGQLIKRQEDKMRLVPSIWPVNAWQISKKYKNTGNPRLDHYGIDLLASDNSSVYSTADGRVIFAGYDKQYGILVVIDHGESQWVTKYGHNKSLLVQEGDYVVRGQAIAVFGGMDKLSTGAHLHYGMIYRGKPENPLDHLPEHSRLSMALQNE